MAAVNCFSILVLVFLAIPFDGSVAEEVHSLGVLASVREHPFNVHRCTATFLAPKFLVTTASCLVCTDKCRMFVLTARCGDENDSGQSYPIVRNVTHPSFDADPQMFDVGMIELGEEAQDATVFRLPGAEMNIFNVASEIFSWGFSDNKREFKLVSYKVSTISNEVCSNYFGEYIRDWIICIRGKETINMGPFDHGTPVIGDFSGSNVFLGLFPKPWKVRDRYVLQYLSSVPFIDWIGDFMNSPNTTTQAPTNPTTHKPPPPPPTTRKPRPTTRKPPPPPTTRKPPHPTTRKPSPTTRRPPPTTRKPRSTSTQPPTTTTTDPDTTTTTDPETTYIHTYMFYFK